MKKPVHYTWKAARGPGMAINAYARASKIHGKGLFTLEALKKGQLIGEYLGKLVKAEDGPDYEVECCFKSHTLDFSVNSKEVIDGRTGNSPLIYTNHAKRPNCEARIHHKRVRFYAKRNIKADEELTINYNCACGDCPK